ncbi:DsbA family protein [Chitinophaga agrisoli]|uniref:DsbA family protein n=1 Tax=Chitinophaga agrisoli TaxID=2607653 RepID=A0A5B2VXC2_9BACT|nr:DsbA family protein [Chitinophaga agrisoli]KAA2242659.1 DsbA family protein [Chitinophaga agrisoli]
MDIKAELHVRDRILEHLGGGLLDIVYYTDPLCCWSWAFEPVWDQLLLEFDGKVQWRYCMGGMLPEWDTYHDTVRAVSKPLQMGPVWLETKQVTGAVIDDKIWFKDPPASSYPACVAVKSAALQSAVAADAYLKKLRMAVMTAGLNIAKKEALLMVAKELAMEDPRFDAGLFEEQLSDPRSIAAFKQDLEEVRLRNIKRFPSLLISYSSNHKKLLLTGYRPYNALLESVAALVCNEP